MRRHGRPLSPDPVNEDAIAGAGPLLRELTRHLTTINHNYHNIQYWCTATKGL